MLHGHYLTIRNQQMKQVIVSELFTEQTLVITCELKRKTHCFAQYCEHVFFFTFFLQFAKIVHGYCL